MVGNEFFFFQAEDGIRDHCVTGVQTCALPICSGFSAKSRFSVRRSRVLGRVGRDEDQHAEPLLGVVADPVLHTRSEERRVGKECSSRPLRAALITPPHAPYSRTATTYARRALT